MIGYDQLTSSDLAALLLLITVRHERPELLVNIIDFIVKYVSLLIEASYLVAHALIVLLFGAVLDFESDDWLFKLLLLLLLGGAVIDLARRRGHMISFVHALLFDGGLELIDGGPD